MISLIVDYQRRMLDEHRNGYVRQLLGKTPSREDDVYARGILRGLELADGILTELQQRAHELGLED